jgi:hypothetical protein
MPINFGTDGWRAVISDEFTFANVRKVAQAIADKTLADKKQQLAVNSNQSSLNGTPYPIASPQSPPPSSSASTPVSSATGMPRPWPKYWQATVSTSVWLKAMHPHR